MNTESFVAKLGALTLMGPVYLFFLIGLFTLKDGPIRFLPILAVLIGSLVVFTIYHSRLRYTLSIFPVMIIFSSHGVTLVYDKMRKFVKKISNL